MFRSLLAMYRPQFAITIVYMLQATEYQINSYLKWLWRVQDFSKVTYRKSLVKTRHSKTLLFAVKVGMLAQLITALVWGIWAFRNENPSLIFAVDLLFSIPLVWTHLVVVPLLLGRWLYVNPLSAFKVRHSQKIFRDHPGIKIAVAGSYGKTTMKEILATVLAEGKKVAATPANKNVAISHAIFAARLKGDEDILIIEYGEGAPGDVAGFSKNTHPNIGIITGLAPAHLDKYKTLSTAGEDIFSLADYLKDNVYVNEESEAVKPFIKKSYKLFSSQEAVGWKVSNVKTSIHGVSFLMKKGTKTLSLQSLLLGRHQVGPLALAVALAEKLGLSEEQIKIGVSKIEPFEHRMQPREAGGAWIIDDTYNGNIEGMLAGLRLLKELPARRKVYVTPGLVDQGKDSAAIHHQLGKAIVRARPDLIILMKHSVTDGIIRGIRDEKYNGQLVIEEDPLNFYNNLDQFVAAGDLVLLQNDWPDNYN
ncbi:MAG TPA: Mur ligase family protein [Candidatus Saccharimonadales bacterium]|uniref:UDP-N-acetylmuramoyl-tripeptide-D-alanyl-D-alanine ligase n=1 Tax=Candidatus Giovannonibacteria bacterium GW2011_GWC2_44_8 TaxID=1618657 RepID=A0A0G1N121_9BACT|nr:MAG: UDP-N-acetylmuramoyl-tripeptide-D-alanyl-D-alanine ligase [Candidatus Giovannonibacteria bacterium GW2011_GWC2_44_8]HLA49490.1 Mur ligase family protein [Candidatus Saccharimonadales bacterium]